MPGSVVRVRVVPDMNEHATLIEERVVALLRSEDVWLRSVKRARLELVLLLPPSDEREVTPPPSRWRCL
jgi:hypothetical protein